MNSFIRISCLVSNTFPNAPSLEQFYDTIPPSRHSSFALPSQLTRQPRNTLFHLCYRPPIPETHAQAMNKAGACTYIVYTFCVCMSVNSAFVRASRSTLRSHNLLFNIAQNVFHIDLHACVKMLPPPPPHLRLCNKATRNAVWCLVFFSGFVFVFVFDTLQILSWCIQI